MKELHYNVTGQDRKELVGSRFQSGRNEGRL